MTQPQLPDGSRLAAALHRSMHEHAGLYVAEGVVLSLLGLAAIVVPPLAGLLATIFLGWVFLIAGFAGLLFTVRQRGAPGFGWALLSAIAALVAGGILLWNPLQGIVTLTYVLIAYFILDGILVISLALAHRRALSGRWEWMLVNGLLDLLLAAVVLSGLPGTLYWALGLLVGIDMVFGGATLIAMALDARKTG